MVLLGGCATGVPRDGAPTVRPPTRPASPGPSPRPQIVSQRPFGDASPLNRPIGARPGIDPMSGPMIGGMFGDGSSAPVADTEEFGFAIYEAAPGTPRVTVTCEKNWGDCPLPAGDVPATGAMVPPPGSDAQVSVIDRSTDQVYEMWQYRWNNGHPTASWGAVTRLDGDGLTDPPDGRGHSRGSGFAELAGVVRRYEIEQGHIDHAVEFSTNRCRAGDFRAPATRTDGQVADRAAIPEGARLQLDPGLDVNSLPGMTPAERMVARAMQVYGAYAMDCGGGAMAIGFEFVPPGGSSPYPAAGLPRDYTQLEHIPTDRLRVLSSWDTGSPP